MKKWTKKFINRRTEDGECFYRDNAKKAEKIGIKPALWIQISEALEISPLTKSIETVSYRPMLKSLDEYKIESAVMAGFAIGWAEKSKEIK
jgi:hypothetical protein